MKFFSIKVEKIIKVLSKKIIKKKEILILFSILNSIQLGLAGINWQLGNGGVVWANACDWADNSIS